MSMLNNSKGRFVYKQFLWQGEITTSVNFIIFKYFKKRFPRKLEIHVLCKFFFFDRLVLMLFRAADDFFLKTNIKKEVE